MLHHDTLPRPAALEQPERPRPTRKALPPKRNCRCGRPIGRGYQAYGLCYSCAGDAADNAATRTAERKARHATQ